MNIVVLVKHTFVSEFRPTITADGKAFEKQKLVYEMNDWDRYALEEAIKIKEQKGGEVVAISVGKDCDDTLRKCFALGADRAIKIPFDSIDSWQIAEVISEAIKAEKFDLILAGFQSQDLNNALVGPIVAGMLNLPYATAATSVKFENNEVRIRRELEAGFQEEDTIPLPCLLSVQTGINRPRYPSTRAVIKARTKEIGEVSITSKSSTFKIKRLYFPAVKRGKTIEGSPEEVSTKLIEVLKGKGLL
jgi:electron transfer flavoprotein beta subunit